MYVVLMPNLTRKNGLAVCKKVCRKLDRLKIEYKILDENRAEFGLDDSKFILESEIDSRVNLLIPIGGDGTMIRAAKIAYEYSVPVLGVNAGNLAYLMGLEQTETDLLKNLLTAKYSIVDRMVLDVTVFDEKKNIICSEICINDAVFRCKDISVTTLDVFCDGKQVGTYNADGIIFASPTGSTAYNLSALGPIVDPKVETIILTPICPHSLVERPILFGSNSVLTVKIDDSADNNCLLSCDGDSGIEFKHEYTAEIRKAKRKARFLSLKEDTFMDVLNRKMKN